MKEILQRRGDYGEVRHFRSPYALYGDIDGDYFGYPVNKTGPALAVALILDEDGSTNRYDYVYLNLVDSGR